jgi:hypothetical protein
MRKILLTLAVFVLSALTMSAQEKQSPTGFKPGSLYTFSWVSTFTLGDFNDWVGNGSPAGFEFSGQYFLKKGLAVGFNVGWQRVQQSYGYQTAYFDDGIAVTATNYRFTWMFPFQGMVAYHLFPEKVFSPYAGLGIGGDYMEHHLLIQEYDIYSDRWDFSLAPEIGLLAKFGYYGQWGALVAFDYKWTTNQIDIENLDWLSKDLQMMNLKIGLTYLIR